jgi:hypothetical protein
VTLYLFLVCLTIPSISKIMQCRMLIKEPQIMCKESNAANFPEATEETRENSQDRRSPT